MKLSEIINVKSPKKLWTENEEGEKIKLVRTLTDNEEGKFVADSYTGTKTAQSF